MVKLALLEKQTFERSHLIPQSLIYSRHMGTCRGKVTTLMTDPAQTERLKLNKLRGEFTYTAGKHDNRPHIQTTSAVLVR